MQFSPTHRRRLSTLAAALGSVLLLSACLDAGHRAPADGQADAKADASAQPPAASGAYSTKTPYAPKQELATYAQPPAGFEPVFVEHVARHGSRAMTGPEAADLALQVWEKARAEGALTPLGEELGPVVKEILAAHQKLGYGNLSARGEQEHREMAVRVNQRLSALFAHIAEHAEHIDVVSSGKDRAVDSARHFAGSLAAVAPDVAAGIGPMRVDKDVLYFHKSERNPDYRTYVDDDQQLSQVLSELQALPRNAEMARHLLLRLYSPAFVDKLASGEYTFVDGDEGKDHVRGVLDAAVVLYKLYQIAPGMSGEGGDAWRMDRFVDADDAAWLAYLDDAESFYEKGPGFSGRDVTYRMAGVLLDDFFARIDARIAHSDDTAAVFRFAHAEQIIPLAALMRLPGSTEQAPAGQLYAYDNNPWRGAEVAPMAANVQWDVYGDGNRHLVRMLYNEKETPFKAGCKPVEEASVFYDYTELKRCFGRR